MMSLVYNEQKQKMTGNPNALFDLKKYV